MSIRRFRKLTTWPGYLQITAQTYLCLFRRPQAMSSLEPVLVSLEDAFRRHAHDIQSFSADDEGAFPFVIGKETSYIYIYIYNADICVIMIYEPKELRVDKQRKRTNTGDHQ